MTNRNSLIVLMLLFIFKYETSDGTSQEEFEDAVSVNGTNVLTIRGNYSYIGTDNSTNVVIYVANEKTDRSPPPVIQAAPVVYRIGTKAICTLMGGC